MRKILVMLLVMVLPGCSKTGTEYECTNGNKFYGYISPEALRLYESQNNCSCSIK